MPDPSSGQDQLADALAAFNAWYEEHIDEVHYDFREGIEAALAACREAPVSRNDFLSDDSLPKDEPF